MVRSITKTDRKINAQWAAAWALLSVAVQREIAKFCMLSDPQVGEVALRLGAK